MNAYVRFGLGLAISAHMGLHAANAEGASGYHLLKTQPLPTVTGWDYLSIDPQGRRLFISDNKGVLVIDIDTLRPVGRAPKGKVYDSVGMVHGVAVGGPLGRGFISLEQPSSIVAFDLKTLQSVFEAPSDPGADAIVFEPVTQRAFVFNGKQEGVHDATAVDGQSGKVLGNVQLPGRPEAVVADGKGSLYVNIADRAQLARINARTLKVDAIWPLSGCEEPSALAIDPAHEVLFSTCDNEKIVMTDADQGRVLGSVRAVSGADAAVFDAKLGYVFASSGQGTLTIAHEDDGRTLKLVDSVRTASQARTMALDPVTHRIFLVTGIFGPRGKKTAGNPHGYPVAQPGTVKLLVVGP